MLLNTIIVQFTIFKIIFAIVNMTSTFNAFSTLVLFNNQVSFDNPFILNTKTFVGKLKMHI